MLHDVAFVQVAGHVGEAQPAQHQPPPGVPPVGMPLPYGFGRRRVDVAEVTRQPVLVQSGLAADSRQAGTVGDPRENERGGLTEIPWPAGGPQLTWPPMRLPTANVTATATPPRTSWRRPERSHGRPVSRPTTIPPARRATAVMPRAAARLDRPTR